MFVSFMIMLHHIHLILWSNFGSRRRLPSCRTKPNLQVYSTRLFPFFQNLKRSSPSIVTNPIFVGQVFCPFPFVNMSSVVWTTGVMKRSVILIQFLHKCSLTVAPVRWFNQIAYWFFLTKLSIFLILCTLNIHDDDTLFYDINASIYRRLFTPRTDPTNN